MSKPSATGAERRRAAGVAAVLLALAPWWRGEGDDTQALRERLAALEAERDLLLGRVEGLELELAREREARLAREQEWLAYTRTIAALVPVAVREELPTFEPLVPAVGAAAPEIEREPTPSELQAQRRRDEVRTTLRALLAAEGVRGLDLLEVGGVQSDHAGPVVFRLLDAQGRLAGSLFAERLRLEASLAGRSLSLVLEQGYESHGGQRTNFGTAADPTGPPPWRISLEGLDPRPWIESLPELAGESSAGVAADDGLWDLAYVQVTLNERLREDTSSGWLRIKRLGGVASGVLRDVHVEVLDPSGVLERRIFADRLTLERSGDGLLLRFEGGVHLRGEERTPFLGGGYRVWLPRARAESWSAAGLPGLVAVPRGPAARRAGG